MPFADDFKSHRTEQMARVSRDCAVARVLNEHKISNKIIARLVDTAASLALEQFMAMVRMELRVIDMNEELKVEAAMLQPIDVTRFLRDFPNILKEQG